jgi:hypothetical protein
VTFSALPTRSSTLGGRAALLAVPLALCACGEGKRRPPVDWNPRPADLGEFCASLAAIACDAREDCCERTQPCDVEARAESCRNDLERVLASGRAEFDAESADGTLDRYKIWADRCEVRVFEFAGVGAVRGTVPAGDACTNSEGELFPLVCEPDTSCDTQSAEPTCEALPGAGDPCEELGLCASGLACRGGECGEPAALGEPCEGDLECASLHCEDAACQDFTQTTEAVLCQE